MYQICESVGFTLTLEEIYVELAFLNTTKWEKNLMLNI